MRGAGPGNIPAEQCLLMILLAHHVGKPQCGIPCPGPASPAGSLTYSLQGQGASKCSHRLSMTLPFKSLLLYTIGFQTDLHTRIAQKDFSKIHILSPHPRPTDIGSHRMGPRNIHVLLEKNVSPVDCDAQSGEGITGLYPLWVIRR